ncbi:Alpha/beta hydrolase [Erythrobacter sp. NAP1]|uniref:alpha/beta hydrolase n=1 Tax=Erythrobacter sp. NAP1 TaxID=237727 RepID=UPI0000687882|nr:alpha/beta fold hydrolase [Erythrobacter sp. NAP1]EAQ28729.1 Alpha/beta hydrolase [Erythrobacter sp. NAP1]
MKKTLCTLAAASLATSVAAPEPVAVTAPGPEGELAGTLIAPEEGKPLVLIVPGSGPTDRDGNNPMGVTAASYRLLAEALAERGIGSLRIDKRGMFGSKAAIPDPNDVTIGGYADDVAAWAQVAKSETSVECVFVLGHSEGGLVTLAAAQEAGDLCGILLVASVGRPLGDTLREQLQSNPANAVVLDEAFAAIDKLEAGERVDTQDMHRGLLPLFNPAVQGFLIDMFARNPAELAASVQVPMLIVAGGKDIQTPVSDAEALAEGQPEAKLVVIEDMNHVLKTVEGDTRLANMATYSDSSLPIHPELVEAVVAFVEEPGI